MTSTPSTVWTPNGDAELSDDSFPPVLPPISPVTLPVLATPEQVLAYINSVLQAEQP